MKSRERMGGIGKMIINGGMRKKEKVREAESKVSPNVGIEPTTTRLRVVRSAD